MELLPVEGEEEIAKEMRRIMGLDYDSSLGVRKIRAETSTGVHKPIIKKEHIGAQKRYHQSSNKSTMELDKDSEQYSRTGNASSRCVTNHRKHRRRSQHKHSARRGPQNNHSYVEV